MAAKLQISLEEPGGRRAGLVSVKQVDQSTMLAGCGGVEGVQGDAVTVSRQDSCQPKCLLQVALSCFRYAHYDYLPPARTLQGDMYCDSRASPAIYPL